MSTLAVAMEEVNNQQTFNLNLDAIHACKFQVQQVIGRRVVDMLEDHVRTKVLKEALGDGQTFEEWAGTADDKDANEFRKWLWVYREMTDTMKFKGQPMDLESYIKYKGTKILDEIVTAQMMGHKNTVAELKREYRIESEKAKNYIAEADNVELDQRYPVGFYEALKECLETRIEKMQQMSKHYEEYEADMALIKGLLEEI